MCDVIYRRPSNFFNRSHRQLRQFKENPDRVDPRFQTRQFGRGSIGRRTSRQSLSKWGRLAFSEKQDVGKSLLWHLQAAGGRGRSDTHSGSGISSIKIFPKLIQLWFLLYHVNKLLKVYVLGYYLWIVT